VVELAYRVFFRVRGAEYEGQARSACLLEFEQGDEIVIVPCLQLHPLHRECFAHMAKSSAEVNASYRPSFVTGFDGSTLQNMDTLAADISSAHI
jgi:hypothetical protein